MTKYIRTYHNGREVVAVFDEGGHKFVMNEESLLSRIRNGERYKSRLTVERKALAFIRAHEKYVPPKK